MASCLPSESSDTSVNVVSIDTSLTATSEQSSDHEIKHGLYLASQKRRPPSEFSNYQLKEDGSIGVHVDDLDVFVSKKKVTSIRGVDRIEIVVDFTPLKVSGEPTSMFIVSSRQEDGQPLSAPNFATLNIGALEYNVGVRQQIRAVFGRQPEPGVDRVLAKGDETDDLIVFVNPMRNGIGSSFTIHEIIITEP